MFLVKMLNPKLEQTCRWIKVDNKTFIIKTLDKKEEKRLTSCDNIVELLKINNNSLTIIKSRDNKIFTGLTL